METKKRLLYQVDRVANPEMIILARESRGQTQAGLAAVLGVTQGRLSKIESGLLPLPENLLVDLCEALEYPPEFFHQTGTRYGVSVAEIFHRKRADTPKKLLAKIYALIDVRIRQIASLLRSVDLETKAYRLDVDEYNGDARRIAQLARASWGIPRGPIHDLTRTIEDVGFLVVPMDFETTHVDAIGRWIPGLPPMIFANQRSPKDRYRFSVAHEIGHLLMHEYPTPDMETQADQFAAELLCPENEIRADLTDLRLDRLPQLKRYWKVSMRALIHRAQDIGAITANRARTLWVQMARAGYTKREPVELDINGEQPELVFEMISTHKEEFGYSVDDLKNLLYIKRTREFIDTFMPAAVPNLRVVGSA